jgi:hypothetical protein
MSIEGLLGAFSPLLGSNPVVRGLLWGQSTPTPLLDPVTRAVLLMSLLAFILLGLGLMAGAMIGGRWVRRLGRVDLTKPLPLRRSAAELREPLPAMLRGVHWQGDSDTKASDLGVADTVMRGQ